jgi:hypothetical protein
MFLDRAEGSLQTTGTSFQFGSARGAWLRDPMETSSGFDRASRAGVELRSRGRASGANVYTDMAPATAGTLAGPSECV